MTCRDCLGMRLAMFDALMARDVARAGRVALAAAKHMAGGQINADEFQRGHRQVDQRDRAADDGRPSPGD